MSTITEKKYVLTIDDTAFEMNTPSAVESPAIDATLKKLSFNKGVYRPGEIFAVFSVPSTYSYDQLKNLFFEEDITGNRRKVTLQYKEKTTEVKAVEKEIETPDPNDSTKTVKKNTIETVVSTTYKLLFTIAENYYVFKMKPIFKRSSDNTQQTVELTIYSHDKLMTLDKYCKAYTARKLGSYIYKENVGNFKFVEKKIKKDKDGNIEKDKNGIPAFDESAQKDVPVSTNVDSVSSDLQVISYEDTTNNNKKDEFIQPYLVQYNESYYDFLKRTANRCGEFLYHEDGKLHLGMTITDNTSQDYGAIASEYCFEDLHDEGMGGNNFAFDYMNSEEIPSWPYDDPLATDEYLDKIPKDYTSYSAQMYLKDRDAVSYVCSALQCSTLGEIGGTLAFQGTFQAIGAAVKEKQLNDTNKQTNIDDWDDDNHKEMWTLDNSGNTDELRQFGTGVDQKSAIDTDVTNLYAKFYDLVRQRQQEAYKNAVFLDFKDNPQNLKLGDLIKVGTNDYLVIEVKGSQELVNDRYEMHQTVVGIRPYNNGTKLIPIPPRLTNLVVRESQAQHATVAVNFDPKKIGRVRVRFAWQTSSDDASPWIRVAMPFATDGGGVKFRPIVGDEVMINFIDGNVEHPYVTGFLLNESCNDAWASLPDRTITSKNGHNITFTDGVDGSNFFLNMTSFSGMIKSFIPTTDLPAKFDTDGGLALTGGTTISDRYKLYQITMSTDNRSILIKSAMGDVSINAFTGINITAPNGNINIAGKNVSISASNKVNITSGTGLKKRFFPDSGLGDNHPWFEKAAFSTIKAFPDFFFTAFDTYAQKLVNKFIDFSFIRSLIELFTRPIDGTTKIKSFTFVQLEAGKGSTEYPVGVKKSDDSPFYLRLDRAVNAISAAVDSRIDAIYLKYLALDIAIQTFNIFSDEGQLNTDGQVLTFEAIRTAGSNETPTHYTESDLTFTGDWGAKEYDENAAIESIKAAMKNSTADKYECDHEPTDEDDRYDLGGAFDFEKFHKEHSLYIHFEAIYNRTSHDKTERSKSLVRTDFVKAANDLVDAFADLKKALDDAKASVKKFWAFDDEDTSAVSDTFDELELTEVGSIESTFKITDITNTHGPEMADAKKKWKRKAVYNMLAAVVKKANKEADGYTITTGDYKSDKNVMDNWDDIVDGFFKKDINPLPDMEDITENVASFMKSKTVGDWKNWWDNNYKNPWADATINHRRWKTGFQGKILMSEAANKTINFNANGNGVENYTNQTASDKSIELFKNKLKALA